MSVRMDKDQPQDTAAEGGTVRFSAFGNDDVVVDYVAGRTVGEYLSRLGRNLERGQKAQIQGRHVDEDHVPEPDDVVVVAPAVKNG